MSPRSAILRLYRQCLKSVNRIPDTEQRFMYDSYVKDGFRSKQALPSESRQAKAAIADATEQLERMNYYHSIRERKEQELKDTNVSGRSERMETMNDVRQAARAPEETVIETDRLISIDDNKKKIVKEWLQFYLPNLYSDDLEMYACHLIQEGFDSKQMLEEELLKEDLHFMKSAHRRVLLRQLRHLRDEQGKIV